MGGAGHPLTAGSAGGSAPVPVRGSSPWTIDGGYGVSNVTYCIGLTDGSAFD